MINITRITPEECTEGGRKLTIDYSFNDSPFGEVLIASTSKGVCCMEFISSRNEAINSLKSLFPNATYINRCNSLQKDALLVFSEINLQSVEINLNIKGTDFQMKVWNELLNIPAGTTVSYSDIALSVNNAMACRAVGRAIGKNPVAIIIPCHRVVQSSGTIGGYRWGSERKTAILKWEADKTKTTY